MADPARLFAPFRAALRCPACGGALAAAPDALACCAAYPVRDGVPVLIDEGTSVFTIADVLGGASATFVPDRGRLRAALSRVTAPPSRNVAARANYARFASLLREGSRAPRVLVIGGGSGGDGIEALAGLDVLVTDVCFGPATALVCLPTAAIPAPCIPRRNACASRATVPGSAWNARSRITRLVGV